MRGVTVSSNLHKELWKGSKSFAAQRKAISVNLGLGEAFCRKITLHNLLEHPLKLLIITGVGRLRQTVDQFWGVYGRKDIICSCLYPRWLWFSPERSHSKAISVGRHRDWELFMYRKYRWWAGEGLCPNCLFHCICGVWSSWLLWRKERMGLQEGGFALCWIQPDLSVDIQEPLGSFSQKIAFRKQFQPNNHFQICYLTL